MSSEQPTTATQLPMVNLDGPKESLKQLKTTLEKCCKDGSFDLDEAFLNKLSLDHLATCVSALEKYQEYAIKTVETQRKIAEARSVAVSEAKAAYDKANTSGAVVQQIDAEDDDLNDDTVNEIIKQSTGHSDEEDTEHLPKNENYPEVAVIV